MLKDIEVINSSVLRMIQLASASLRRFGPSTPSTSFCPPNKCCPIAEYKPDIGGWRWNCDMCCQEEHLDHHLHHA
jgi:hypothetical protein